MKAKLTDLEICKNIAEIEGYKTSVTDNKQGIWASFYKNDCYGWFNPLIDDALCFQLMLKHDIRLLNNSEDGKNKYVAMWSHCRGEDDESPHKAICLAIIEKQKYYGSKD